MIGTLAQRAAAFLAGCLLVFSLSGCGAIQPDLGEDAAKRLQSQVLKVTELAAADDPAAALNALEDLARQVDTAAANGEVSFKRHQSLYRAIDDVRADLEADQAAAQAKADADAAAAAASAAPNPLPSPRQSAATDENGGKDTTPGKGKGKGGG